MQGIRILGIDPGFANIGAALMLYAPDVPDQLLEVDFVETKLDKKKKGLRAKSDEMRRLGEIRDYFDLVSRTWDYDVVAFEEMPTGIRGSSAIRKVACAWGGIWMTLTRRRGVLSFEYSPTELKRAVTGRTRASKAEMVEALGQRYPKLLELDIPESKMEHPADAIAAAKLAMQDPAVHRLYQSLARFAG